MIRNWKCNTT